MAQQQQVLTQRIFLAGPSQWDSWLTAVKTQALAKEIWRFADPDGNGPTEPIIPPEITLESFMAKYGIPIPAPEQPEEPEQTGPQDTPTVTPASTPAPRAIEYLAATSSLALEYSGPQNDSATDSIRDPFQVYSDASFGDCPRTRRSTGGFLITL